jgi:hypothetical protein
MELNLHSPITPSQGCTRTSTSDEGRKEGWEQGSVWERKFGLWTGNVLIVQLVSVNTHKPIAWVQRDDCSSFHLTNKAFAIACFGTKTAELVVCNLQPAGHMPPAEIVCRLPYQNGQLFFKSDSFNFVNIVQSSTQYLSYNKILAYCMGRSRRMENLQWEKWEKYEVVP